MYLEFEQFDKLGLLARDDIRKIQVVLQKDIVNPFSFSVDRMIA